MGQVDGLRDLIAELRTAGKRVVAWSYSYDRITYYLACAADEVLLLTGGTIAPLGIAQRYVYLAESLNRIGLKADILQISPYKSAGDMLAREGMSEEVREMANWLIDATYQELIQAIAAGRDVDQVDAREIVDSTPCMDLKAEEMGMVDALLNEEQLNEYLGKDGEPAKIATWETVASKLLRRSPRRPGKYVALMSIEGTIMDGHSQRPPVDPPLPIPIMAEPRAGDLSVVQVARQIVQDKRAAAVVVYVNSRGGSVTASESIRAALEKIAAQKPLIISMGSVAASGGYYVSTPAMMILAQPNSISGSIGVLSGKVSNAGLLEKLLINRETITRGEGALFMDFDKPLDEEERAVLWEHIQRMYDLFLDHIIESRAMERNAVESVAGGRVWTGRQAMENGLLDELGGLQQSLKKAREMAGLYELAPVRMYHPADKYSSAPLATPSSILKYIIDGLKFFNRSGPLYIFPLVDLRDNFG
ncbi:MAG: signal peptide peptidase SppA [Anaerolineales bacterium]